MRTSKLNQSIVASLALLAAACNPPAGNQAENSSGATPAAGPSLPVVEPSMARSDLVLAAGRAASATALGRNDTSEQRRLDGSRFEVRLRIGCPEGGAANGPATPFEVQFDEGSRTLRFRAAPDLILDDPLVEPWVDKEVEAVEGFWLPRPWLLDDGCPKIQTQPSPIEAPAEASADGRTMVNSAAPSTDVLQDTPLAYGRIGLAQFFTDADPRTSRRGSRAYAATKVLAQGEQPSTIGYNLVLFGRLRQRPGGRVIDCRARSASAPPDCVIAVEFDRVVLERPDTKSILAEWSS